MHSRLLHIIKRHKIKFILVVLFMLYWVFSIPQQVFKDPHATVVESASGELLGARIASDGQWRFPALDSVPHKFEKCILLFEDEYFYTHPGLIPWRWGRQYGVTSLQINVVAGAPLHNK